MRAAALGALLLLGCPNFDEAYDRCVVDGTCRDVSVLFVSVAPETATFEAAVGARAVQAFTFTSDAGDATPPLLIRAEGSAFALVKDPCSGAPLAPGAQCTVVVAFAPVAAGVATGRLELATRVETVRSAALVGHGLDGWPLRIALAGAGAGTVVGSGDLTCPPACEQVLARDGGAVTLTAQPAAGSTFAGWSRDCSGSGACVVTPGAPRSVTATFDLLATGARLELSATGPGRLSVSPPGEPCGPHCLRYLPGTQVTLTASALRDHTFAGWSKDCSGAAAVCTLQLSADRAARASFAGPNVVFATSRAVVPGLLGGADGGDALCDALAADAGLHQPFFAWLSTPGASAAARLGSARGWVHPDGVPFADQLPSPRIYYPVELDERGDLVTGSGAVATGTTADGALASDHCAGWTSTSAAFRGGSARGGSVEWTDDRLDPSLLPSLRSCGGAARLYCLTADRAAPVPPRPIPDGGRRFFLAEAAASGDLGGLLGADARCNALAADAGLPGSYVAWLTSNDAGPAARVAAGGGDWFRPDGVRLGTAAALRDAEPALYAAPNVTASGQYAEARAFAWLGGVNSLDGGLQSCGEWTSTAGSARQVDFLRTDAFSRITLNAQCNTPRPFFCAEL